MKVTLNQIIKQLETFADNHKGIKQFEAKPLTEFTANNYLYPLMWVEIRPGTFETGEARVNLNIYMVDRLKPDYDNFVRVISDTLKLCNDVYSYFTEYEEDFGFYTDNSASFTPVEYAFDDNVAGNQIELTVQVCLDRNKNEVPI